jgi:hypothetical protein
MENKNRLMMKITMGVAAAGLSLLSLLPAPNAPMSQADTERALVYGRADSGWTARAAELAAADGDFATQLGRIAESDRSDSLGRGHVLDALARAGTPAAQKAMQATLRAPAVTADGAYALLVSRLGSLQAPTGDTLEYLGRTHVAAVAAGNGQLALASESALDSVFDHRLAMLSRHARRPQHHR